VGEGGQNGVFGKALNDSGTAIGVKGQSSSSLGVGVFGENTSLSGATYGVRGVNQSGGGGAGVRGDSTNVGLWADSTGRWGVYGRSTNDEASYGIYGTASGEDCYAGFFQGDVHIARALTKGSGAFKIDHPLDPENKYLMHSFVESPDMMNIYNGNVILNDEGQAGVELPEWFEALNRDFRYQLTAIGGPGADLHILEEIEENSFRIAGGRPGLKVSWQVTGIRKDAYAEAHRIPVEVEKPAREKGLFLHPEAHGKDIQMQINHSPEKKSDKD
jgi:hypothetical protein